MESCPNGYETWKKFRDEAMSLVASANKIQSVIFDISGIEIPDKEWFFISGALHSIRMSIMSKKYNFALLSGEEHRKNRKLYQILYHTLYAQDSMKEAQEFLGKAHMQNPGTYEYTIKSMAGYAEIRFVVSQIYPIVFPMKSLKRDINALISDNIVNIVICSNFDLYGESSRSEMRGHMIAWVFNELLEVLNVKLPKGVTIRFADPTLNTARLAAKQDWPIDDEADSSKKKFLKPWGKK
ncbi:MAG: hypothetical protein ACNFW9_05335 [Candidatus Kerfeldbacteria bacterium]